MTKTNKKKLFFTAYVAELKKCAIGLANVKNG